MAKKLSAADILAAAKAAPIPLRQPPKPVRQRHELRTESADEAAIYEAVVEFWQKVAAVARLPLAEPWDILLCILADSGRISAAAVQCILPFRFPRYERDLDRRAEPLEHFQFPKTWEEVALIITQHEIEHEAIGDRCADDDLAFEQGFQELLAHKVQLLRTAASDSRVSGLWQDIPSCRGAFAVGEGDSFPHETNLIPLFGEPLPPPAPPQTALEVFSRLYQHTSRTISTNCGLKFEDDELVRVSLTGRDTTDETIALLEQVDNLQQICVHGHEIDLSNSAVSTARFAKLAASLPHVKILR